MKMNNTTYYQRNREVILNRAKDYYENDKKDWESKQEINIETYLKKIKGKKENTEKIPKKRIPKKISRSKKV